VALLQRIKAKIHAFLATTMLLSVCLVLLVKCVRYPVRFLSYDRKKPENAPIFIVGCGHSGTTLLLALLDSHSNICAIPRESAMAYDYAADCPRIKWNAHLMMVHFDLLAISQNKKRWVEKTPKHIRSISLLRKLVPGCKFVIILRDGRDVACSMEVRFGSLEEGINRWVKDNRTGEAFWKDPDFHVVKYEDIVSDTVETMKKLFHFLGEEFEERVLRSHEIPKYYYYWRIAKPPDASDKHHAQYRTWQINQKLFDGRGRWKQLSDEKKALIKDVAGDLLIEYGYASDRNW
jgi:hypothetical protein